MSTISELLPDATPHYLYGSTGMSYLFVQGLDRNFNDCGCTTDCAQPAYCVCHVSRKNADCKCSAALDRGRGAHGPSKKTSSEGCLPHM